MKTYTTVRVRACLKNDDNATYLVAVKPTSSSQDGADEAKKRLTLLLGYEPLPGTSYQLTEEEAWM